MKITITRAFERTRQIADFVPIKAYCEASAEVDLDQDSFFTGDEEEEDLREKSAILDEFVRAEVDKTLKEYRPTCIVCGGRGDKVNLNKEGVCEQCVKTANFQAQELKRETITPKVANQNKPNA